MQPMSLLPLAPPPLWRHPEFARGARDMAGAALGIAAWGLVTGVAMAKSGLPMPLALLMSLIVFAGSAQLAALPLLAGGAPLWVDLGHGVVRQPALRRSSAPAGGRYFARCRAGSACAWATSRPT